MDEDRKSLVLYDAWIKENPKLTQEVMSQDECDIEPAFMCFAEIYFHLSQMIPKHWTIVDLGCAFAPQCFYFRDHAGYVGIDPGMRVRFRIKNTRLYSMNIKTFIGSEICENMDKERTFAIMSYVPADDYSYFLAKNCFKNMFIYYPSGDPIKLKIRTDAKSRSHGKIGVI